MRRTATKKVCLYTPLTSQYLNSRTDFVNHTYDSVAIAGLTVQKAFEEKWKSLDPQARVTVVPTIQEALEYARALSTGDVNEGDAEVHTLITGSLHLVGGALGVLEGVIA
jgi:folylpolyglutamate synthase